MRGRGNNRVPYVLAAVVVFGSLVLIESRFSGGFVRFTAGDLLVVVFLYLLVMATRPSSGPIGVGFALLAFAIGVEVGQLVGVAELVGLPDTRLVKVIFGNVFSWLDIGAYAVGLVVVVAGDLIVRRWSSAKGGPS